MVQATDFFSQEDYEAALDERQATPDDARREYAHNVGQMQPERAWVLTDWDTWERNPYYQGPPAPHPEDDADDAAHQARGDERIEADRASPAPRPDLDDDCPF